MPDTGGRKALRSPLKICGRERDQLLTSVIITCPDSFVSISNSTVPLRRLFQQHRPN
jgi:hypothetical protein